MGLHRRGTELEVNGRGRPSLPKQKSPALPSGAFPCCRHFAGEDAGATRLVHSVHAAAAVAAACWSTLLLFRDLRHQRFGGQHERRD